MFQRLVLMVLIGWSVSPAFAQNSNDSAVNDGYSSYYKIAEPKPIKAYLMPQMELMPLKPLVRATGDLLRWALNRTDWPLPDSPYNRRQKFGNWLKDHTKDSCLNTRAKILIRESKVPVRMSANGCTVVEGEWDDPYTGTIFTRASQVQIDHMVPLKNAYVSGAWRWSQKDRCAYTNFRANRFHLVAVSGHENMSKGDRSPADWLPSNPAFVCEYLKDWLSVKLIWGLILGPREGKAIKQALRAYRCQPEEFEMAPGELAEQRVAIQQSYAQCH
jgi:hypothetical protein